MLVNLAPGYEKNTAKIGQYSYHLNTAHKNVWYLGESDIQILILRVYFEIGMLQNFVRQVQKVIEYIFIGVLGTNSTKLVYLKIHTSIL